MTKEYVEMREGAFRISGTRVSLDSVVYAFLRGASPESIAQSFPALNLEEIYGTITFYLAHRAEIDTHLQEGERESYFPRPEDDAPCLCGIRQRRTQSGCAHHFTKSRPSCCPRSAPSCLGRLRRRRVGQPNLCSPAVATIGMTP